MIQGCPARSLLLVALLSQWPLAAGAAVVADAQVAYGAGEYHEAAALLKPLADRGEKDAQFFLGRMYERGDGLEADRATAVKYYRLAAGQGHARAGERLHQMLDSGSGEDSVVLDWYLPAARDGDVDVMFNLGYMYETGWGVGIDQPQAVAWYRQAAEADHAGAQLRLGMMLMAGAGEAQDVAAGVKWIRQAAEQGHRIAERLVQEIFDVPADWRLDKVKIVRGLRILMDDDESRVVEMLPKIVARARAGSPQPQQTSPDTVSAKAPPAATPSALAELEIVPASSSTTHDVPLIKTALGISDVDLRQQVNSVRAAAVQGQPDAQFNLAVLFLQGRGIRRDEHEAMRWLQAAADQGHALAEAYLASMQGPASLPGETVALDWLQESARHWDTDALFFLGFLYETGRGVTPAPEKALQWYRFAASQGHSEARRRVAALQSGRTSAADGTVREAANDAAAGWWAFAVGVLAVVLFWLNRYKSNRMFNVRKLAVCRMVKRPIPRADTDRIYDDDLDFVNELWAQPAKRIIDVVPAAVHRSAPEQPEAPPQNVRAASATKKVAVVGQIGRNDHALPATRQRQAGETGQQSKTLPPRSGQTPMRATRALGLPVPELRGARHGDHQVARVEGSQFLPTGSEQIVAGLVGPKKRAMQRISATQLANNSIALTKDRMAALQPRGAEAHQAPAITPPSTQRPAASQPGKVAANHSRAKHASSGTDDLADVQYNIGRMFAYGEDVMRNEVMAVKWYLKAAERGHPIAAYSLWEIHAAGRKTGLDAQAARRYLERSAQGGYELAKRVLERQKRMAG